MKIILSNADFSANNIGLSDLILRDSVSEADAFLATLSSVTENSQFALRDFIFRLKAAGIYSKINILLIPAIANNLTEADRNVINLSDALPASYWKDPTYVNFNAAEKSINKVLAASAVYLNIGVVEKNNTHFVINKTTDVANLTTLVRKSYIEYYDVYPKYITSYANNVSFMTSQALITQSELKGLFGTSYGTDRINFYANGEMASGIITNDTGSVKVTTSGGIVTTGQRFNYLSIGTYLSASEMKLYGDLVQVFLNNLSL